MPWTSGLDLGQASDPAALACCKQVQGIDPLSGPKRLPCWFYHVLLLREFPLGTPYTTVGHERGIGEQVRDLYTRPMPDGNPLQGTTLAVDYTGVGRPVYDILRGLRIPALLVPITYTGGSVTHQHGLEFTVPKGELVSNLLKLYQCGRVRVPPTLKLQDKLAEQLNRFRPKQKDSGHIRYEGETARDHDDILLALAEAVWVGERVKWVRRSDIGMGGRAEQADAPAGTFLGGKMPERW